MSSYSALSTTGQVVLGEVETVWTPRTVRTGRVGVILLHGQSNPQMFMQSAHPTSMKLAAAISGFGIPCIAAEMHGNSWAINVTMEDDIPVAHSILVDQFGCDPDRIILLGISMGGSLAVRYSQLNPEATAGIVGVIPAYDPKALYIHGDVGDAAMEAAWGFSGLENFPTELDLGAQALRGKGTPIMSIYASDDALVPASSVENYHRTAGGLEENLINVGALGHTDAALAAVPFGTIIKFLIECGA